MDGKLPRDGELNLKVLCIQNKEDIMAKKRATSRKTARKPKKTSARKTKTRRTARPKKRAASHKR
jgi:hypothetical protein